MLSLSPFAQSLHFHQQTPIVSVLDVREDTSAQTTYTFTSCNMGVLGGTASVSGDVVTTHPISRSRLRRWIGVIVHGEDALATFGVDSVTIGGVAGTERTDRGGGTNAINTAIYSWDSASLEGITTTDIAVTFSEAVTGCAIGVVSVENSGLLAQVTTVSQTGTGVINIGANSGANTFFHPVVLFGSTCATGGGTELVEFYEGITTSTRNQLVQPTLLYAGSNANFDYAGAWSYAPGYGGAGSAEGYSINVSWSGTGAGDVAVWIAH